MASVQPGEQERKTPPGVDPNAGGSQIHLDEPVAAELSATPPPTPDRNRSAARSKSAGIPARLAAVALAALALLPLLGKSGIWDPYELDAADLARRIAIRAFGARGLDLPGASGVLPTLTDLKMGELSFTSVAVGFRLFGLHDWAGRLPLALWGLVGALVLYEFLARHVDRSTGLYAIAILVTMPLYAMQARTMLGDIVTMAALTMAFCGLTGALLGSRGGARVGALGAWLSVGGLGLLAGYLSRGLLIGIAIPSLGVGLTWLVLRTITGEPAASPRSVEPRAARVRRLSDALGVVLLLAGMAATAKGVALLLTTDAGAPLPRALGVALLRKPPVDSTFDLTLRQLGHALFPWSAFLPFAIGRLFRAPARRDDEVAPPGPGAATVTSFDDEASIRVALLVTSAVAYGAFALLAPYAGPLPFSAPALLAAIAALAIRDLERGAPPSRALAVGCALLAFILYRDFILDPSKALSVFYVDKAVFPKSFEGEAATVMRLVMLVFAGLVGLTWFEEQPPVPELRLRGWAERLVADYRAGAAELSRIWSGNLLFVLVVIEAALVGLGAMLFIGRRIGWSAVARMPDTLVLYSVNAWWSLPLVLALAPAALVAVRDGFRFVVARTAVPRAVGTLFGGLLAGFALSFWYYPALAAQLSPKEVFESYASLRKPGEPLAVLGLRSRAAAYYQGGDVASFTEVVKAFTWLTEPLKAATEPSVPPPPAERRWLVVKADDLPKLNSFYRKHSKRNLPVLDGRSSQILLASNDLDGRPNQSWLGALVLDEPPAPKNPIDAMFDDQLEVLGWEMADRDGNVVASVVPQKTYQLRTYFRVRRAITGSWKMFVHIDGFQRRYNGDHPVLDGRYPISLWQPGDIVADTLEVQLEPNFTPGDYTLYFGFFSGDTRFKVTRGPADDDRVIGGALRVR